MPASTKKKNLADSSKADLAHLLSYRLSVVSNLLSRSLVRRFQSISEISLPEWRMLVLVSVYAPVTVKSLSRHAGLDFGQTSRLVTRMCEMGRMIKTPGEDARSVELSLTTQGRALHRKLWAVAMECNDSYLHGLSAAQQELLFGALDTLAAAARVEPAAKTGSTRRPTKRA